MLSIVDGAHVPGQLPLDLARLGADVYAGNCHKWLCAPKGAGFLWARPEHQDWIDPLVVSWGYGRGSFAERHGWQGTRDPAAALAVPAAIEAHRSFDLERCRRLAASFHDRLPPVGPNPAPQMWASEVDAPDPEALQRRLFDEHRIEVVVLRVGGEEPAARLDRAVQRGRRRREAARRPRRVRRPAGLTAGLTAGTGYGTLAPCKRFHALAEGEYSEKHASGGASVRRRRSRRRRARTGRVGRSRATGARPGHALLRPRTERRRGAAGDRPAPAAQRQGSAPARGDDRAGARRLGHGWDAGRGGEAGAQDDAGRSVPAPRPRSRRVQPAVPGLPAVLGRRGADDGRVPRVDRRLREGNRQRQGGRDPRAGRARDHPVQRRPAGSARVVPASGRLRPRSPTRGTCR